MGAITYYVDGMPVTVSDRTYSFDSTVSPVDEAAFKSWGDSGSLVDLWRHQPALRMVTSFLADNIAQVPLHAFTRSADGDRERLDPTHPLSRALRWPDRPRMTAFDMMWTLVLDMCLYDRYAAQVLMDADGGVQLVRIPPTQWKFERDTLKRPQRIAGLRSDGSDFTIGLDRTVWLDGYPTQDETSPVESLRGILAEADAAAKYRMQLWQNGGRFPGWITRPREAPAWTEDARTRFKAGWDAYSDGGTRTGKSPLLEDGMDYHESTGITPEKGQALEARKLTIAEVANAYHIPPQMVGQDSGSSYNSVAGYREQLYADTLGVWFRRIQDALNARLVPQLADPDVVYVEFNVQEKLRLSFDEQARIFQAATGGPFMVANEARSRMNLPRIEGGDTLVSSGSSRELSAAEVSQKVYLAVKAGVLSTEEGRALIQAAGADIVPADVPIGVTTDG